MPNQITGRVRVSVSGNLLRSKSGAKLNIGGVERTPVDGDSGPHGFTEKTMVPFIECVISHTSDTDLEELKNMTDESITFETDTGKSYVLRNAWLENVIELAGGDGEVSLKFSGMSAEQVS